jgi:hypothetical protein
MTVVSAREAGTCTVQGNHMPKLSHRHACEHKGVSRSATSAGSQSPHLFRICGEAILGAAEAVSVREGFAGARSRCQRRRCGCSGQRRGSVTQMAIRATLTSNANTIASSPPRVSSLAKMPSRRRGAKGAHFRWSRPSPRRWGSMRLSEPAEGCTVHSMGLICFGARTRQVK